MPVILINEMEKDKAALSVFDFLGVAGWIFGFVFEVTADIEKFCFRCDPANKNKFIKDGVWAYCR